MYVIDTDKVKCKFCLSILTKEEMSKNGTICDECQSIIYQTPELSNKMELHIQNVKNFIKKYKPIEVDLNEAITFLANDYVKDPVQKYTRGSIDDRYFDMAKAGIKVAGKMLMVSFIPRVVEFVKYTAFRKVQKITKATSSEKTFLRHYWLEHYFYDLPDNWDYVIHLSFIQRKDDSYQESIYDFPSCVIEKYYTLMTYKPVHEIFSQVFTTEEFATKYKSYSAFLDLRHIQLVSIQTNMIKNLQNSSLITITSDEWKENRYYDPDNRYSKEYYKPNSYFYYNSSEKIFIAISYYEYVFLVLTHLVGFINRYYNLPQSIDINLSKKTRNGVYITIKSYSTFISKTFIENVNNYDIGKDPTSFFENAMEQPRVNVQYIPMIHPREEIVAFYADTSENSCKRCTKKIEKEQVVIAVKTFRVIEKQYHIGCVDVSYVKNQIYMAGLTEEDKQKLLI